MSQEYSEIIKQHYRHPLNTGKLSHYTHHAEQLNLLCGDETKVYLKIAKVDNSRGRGNYPLWRFLDKLLFHPRRED